MPPATRCRGCVSLILLLTGAACTVLAIVMSVRGDFDASTTVATGDVGGTTVELTPRNSSIMTLSGHPMLHFDSNAPRSDAFIVDDAALTDIPSDELADGGIEGPIASVCPEFVAAAADIDWAYKLKGAVVMVLLLLCGSAATFCACFWIPVRLRDDDGDSYGVVRLTGAVFGVIEILRACLLLAIFVPLWHRHRLVARLLKVPCTYRNVTTNAIAGGLYRHQNMNGLMSLSLADLGFEVTSPSPFSVRVGALLFVMSLALIGLWVLWCCVYLHGITCESEPTAANEPDQQETVDAGASNSSPV